MRLDAVLFKESIFNIYFKWFFFYIKPYFVTLVKHHNTVNKEELV